MTQNLPPVQSNQQLVDPKTGFGRPPFILLINNLITGIVNSTAGLINAFFNTKPTGTTPIVTSGTYGSGVTIGFDGGLGDLNDVSLTPAPTDKQVLTFVSADGKWEPKNPTGGGGGGPVGESAWVVTATGTGSSQTITIPDNNPALQALLVSVNGIRYPTSLYTVSGTTVTLTTNSSGDSIEIVGPVGDGTNTPFVVDAVGTGTSQSITMPLSGLTLPTVLVYVNGVRQPTSLYTIVGNTLTLSTNASGDTIEIVGPLGYAVAQSYSTVATVQISTPHQSSSGTFNMTFPTATTVGNTIAFVMETYIGTSLTPPPGFIVASTYGAGNQIFYLCLGPAAATTTYAFTVGDWSFGMGYELLGTVGTLITNGLSVGSPWSTFIQSNAFGTCLRLIVGGANANETWAFTSSGVTTDLVANTNSNHTGIIGRLDLGTYGVFNGTRSSTSDAIVVTFILAGISN